MTPEEIARHYENQNGYDLVDYAEIALPLWQLNIEAISAAHRRFQPISEYVMRAMQCGLEGDDIRGFLGLDEDVAQGTITQLISEGFVQLDDNMPKLSETGRRAISAEGISIPTEEQLSVLYDGILRKPIESAFYEFLSPKEINDGVAVEIPAIPNSYPEVGDLSRAEIVNVLERQKGGRAAMGKDILRLKRISRHRRLYRRGIGLVFKGKREKNLRLFFIVDGKLNETLQHKFAELGGTLRPGLVRAFSDSYISANVRRHLGLGKGVGAIDISEYEKHQQQVTNAKLKTATLKKRLEGVANGELAASERPSVVALNLAIQEERDAVSALESVPLRPAAVYEPAELLDRALSESKSTFSISTFGFAPHIATPKFTSALRKLANRGVKITLTLHETSFNWVNREGDWVRPYKELESISRDFPSLLKIRRGKEDRFFHLSWDDRLALISTRPLLSNLRRRRNFEQFAGYVIQDPSLVKAYLDRVLDRDSQ